MYSYISNSFHGFLFSFFNQPIFQRLLQVLQVENLLSVRSPNSEPYGNYCRNFCRPGCFSYHPASSVKEVKEFSKQVGVNLCWRDCINKTSDAVS